MSHAEAQQFLEADESALVFLLDPNATEGVSVGFLPIADTRGQEAARIEEVLKALSLQATKLQQKELIERTQVHAIGYDIRRPSVWGDRLSVRCVLFVSRAERGNFVAENPELRETPQIRSWWNVLQRFEAEWEKQFGKVSVNKPYLWG